MRDTLLFGLQEDSSREQQKQTAHPTRAVMAPQKKLSSVAYLEADVVLVRLLCCVLLPFLVAER